MPMCSSRVRRLRSCVRLEERKTTAGASNHAAWPWWGADLFKGRCPGQVDFRAAMSVWQNQRVVNNLVYGGAKAFGAPEGKWNQIGLRGGHSAARNIDQLWTPFRRNLRRSCKGTYCRFRRRTINENSVETTKARLGKDVFEVGIDVHCVDDVRVIDNLAKQRGLRRKPAGRFSLVMVGLVEFREGALDPCTQTPFRMDSLCAQGVQEVRHRLKEKTNAKAGTNKRRKPMDCRTS
eukprot:6138040-Amphidinium_carterae.6